MCLNAEKCAFGVRAGKFLGYLITDQGIEVNPDQIDAVKRLELPSNPKEECDTVFRDFKDYLMRTPMLTAPEPGEDLFMYLLVFKHAVSAMLLRDQGM